MHHLQLDSQALGGFGANCYVLGLDDNRCVVFDPGAEPDTIKKLIDGRDVAAILLTHAHGDHIGAVNDIKRITDAPVYLHPAEAPLAKHIAVDHDLHGGDTLQFGDVQIKAVHTPGHSDGMISFLLPNDRAIVGDTLFEGGPGKTWSADGFRATLHTLRTILTWRDETICYPGHGNAFRLGDLRNRIEAFVERDHPADFYGDAEW